MAELEQPAPISATTPLVDFNIRIPAILVLLAAMAVALVIRLLLASLPGFGVDTGTFQAWSQSLANGHPWNFYQPNQFTDYAPGYMYVLWLIGETDKILHFSHDEWVYILKVPAIVADMASAYLVYKMLEKQGPATQLLSTLIYLFFPPALLIGAFWGQVDSILAFFLLLSVYFISREKPVAGAVAFTIGFLVKPQAIAALPFLAFWIMRQYPLKMREGRMPEIPRVWIQCTVAPLLVLLLLITPFFEYKPWRLVSVLYNATDVPNYRVNSFFAYNFWNTGGIFKMGFKCDLQGACVNANATKFLGISTRYWSLFLFASSIATILYILRNARDTGMLALGTALSTLAFYLFLTRMHERYVFAAFLPLLVACALIRSRVLWGAFAAMAAIHFANLYHVFGYYYLFAEKERDNFPDILRWGWLYHWLEGEHDIPLLHNLSFIGTVESVQLLSIAFVTAFVGLLGFTYYLMQRRPPPEAT